MRIDLSKKQLEALVHRLEVPDALAECLSAEENDGEGYHPDDIGLVVDALLRGVDASGIDVTEADAFSEAITDAVLRDCVEGSTWVGCVPKEQGQLKLGAFTALVNLARRLERARGLESICVPHC